MGTDPERQSENHKVCISCGRDLPPNRTRFCSAACLGQFKREKSRAEYGHRHIYQCVECGHKLRLGRHRK
jgi:hypothetical protein